jgi:hypothetical protein
LASGLLSSLGQSVNYEEGVKVVIEVGYKTTKDAADPHTKFTRTEVFESAAVPDRQAIIKKLTDMHKDFAENTITISENNEDAEKLRRSGLRVTKI